MKCIVVLVGLALMFGTTESATPPADGCFRNKGEWGIPLTSMKNMSHTGIPLQWGPAPYGTSSDRVGMVQFVNGGDQTMWIRYDGKGIMAKEPYDWWFWITEPSPLNGNKSHKWNTKGNDGMDGQGNGFKLEPGEYQILPFVGRGWAGSSLGCDANGANCAVSPKGRGAGTDASADGQPNTLFEWAVPGVWDASLVDGFGPPLKVEVDGCGGIGSGSVSDCGGGEAENFFELDPKRCPNKILNAQGHYVGCASMCGCQRAAQAMHQDTTPMCPGMRPVSSIVNQPHAPGGYCGCGMGDCVPWVRNLYKSDGAGKSYCDAIANMSHDSKGKRLGYCQCYDDDAASRSYGNGILKLTFCTKGFEWVHSYANATKAAEVLI
jgi:hypothetical protein